MVALCVIPARTREIGKCQAWLRLCPSQTNGYSEASSSEPDTYYSEATPLFEIFHGNSGIASTGPSGVVV